VTTSLIAAIASNGTIGDRGALPWKLPDDMARFRGLTMGHAVIMGRMTFQSLRKPLHGRRNIVLSRDAGLSIEGCLVVPTLQAALDAASDDEEAIVIGGASVYALFLPGAHRLYLTWIDVIVAGDTVFPEVDWNAWRVIRETAGLPGGALPHRFVDYERAPGYTDSDAG
jgi:dihydrofolate reductase